MFLRKVKNKLYSLRQKRTQKRSHIDLNAELHKDSRVISSELHGPLRIGARSVIHKAILSGKISIGSNTTLWGPDIEVLSKTNPIEIGNYCSIARNVSIQEYFHNHRKVTTYFIGRNLLKSDLDSEFVSKGPIKIGSDVWIGTGCQIMSGVSIGHGAVIGANSTVTKNVPPYAIVGGVPAKIISYRFSDEIIDKLLELKWWDWEIEKIKRNQQLFDSNITLEKLKTIID